MLCMLLNDVIVINVNGRVNEEVIEIYVIWNKLIFF